MGPVGVREALFPATQSSYLSEFELSCRASVRAYLDSSAHAGDSSPGSVPALVSPRGNVWHSDFVFASQEVRLQACSFNVCTKWCQVDSRKYRRLHLACSSLHLASVVLRPRRNTVSCGEYIHCIRKAYSVTALTPVVPRTEPIALN